MQTEPAMMMMMMMVMMMMVMMVMMVMMTMMKKKHISWVIMIMITMMQRIDKTASPHKKMRRCTQKSSKKEVSHQHVASSCA